MQTIFQTQDQVYLQLSSVRLPSPVICTIIQQKNMNTKNIVLSVAVTLAALSFAFAEPTSKMVVMPSQKSEVFNVIYEGASAGKVVLEITDRNGNLLLSETTTGLSKFKRPINFTDMESGVYTITTKDAHGVIKQTVNYQTKSESVKKIGRA